MPAPTRARKGSIRHSNAPPCRLPQRQAHVLDILRGGSDRYNACRLRPFSGAQICPKFIIEPVKKTHLRMGLGRPLHPLLALPAPTGNQSMPSSTVTVAMLAFVAAFACPLTATLGADVVSQVFLRDAIQDNLAEIQLAQLVQQKTENLELQTYTDMLVKEDSAANEQAEKAAAQIGVAVPSEPSFKQRAIYEAMSKLSGSTLEHIFLRELIAEQKAKIPRFQNEARKRNDPVADFANQMLPILQKHLHLAQQLQSGA